MLSKHGHLQAVVLKMAGWVTSMSFEASTRVGDFGTLYATDAAAAIVKINPCIVDGPNVWKENSQVQWKLTGTVKDAKLNFLLAFRYVFVTLMKIITPSSKCARRFGPKSYLYVH